MKHINAISKTMPAHAQIGIGIFEKVQIIVGDILDAIGDLFGNPQ